MTETFQYTALMMLSIILVNQTKDDLIITILWLIFGIYNGVMIILTTLKNIL